MLVCLKCSFISQGTSDSHIFLSLKLGFPGLDSKSIFVFLQFPDVGFAVTLLGSVPEMHSFVGLALNQGHAVQALF